MAPRAGDDVCMNEEDADKSATAFSLPASTSQPINDELTSDEVAKFSTTISLLESHTLQSTSDNCHRILCESNEASRIRKKSPSLMTMMTMKFSNKNLQM